jgi:hypothetical protein
LRGPRRKCASAENVAKNCVCSVKKQVLNSGKILKERFNTGQQENTKTWVLIEKALCGAGK